jgi:hypothetical protein
MRKIVWKEIKLKGKIWKEIRKSVRRLLERILPEVEASKRSLADRAQKCILLGDSCAWECPETWVFWSFWLGDAQKYALLGLSAGKHTQKLELLGPRAWHEGPESVISGQAFWRNLKYSKIGWKIMAKAGFEPMLFGTSDLMHASLTAGAEIHPWVKLHGLIDMQDFLFWFKPEKPRSDLRSSSPARWFWNLQNRKSLNKISRLPPLNRPLRVQRWYRFALKTPVHWASKLSTVLP